MAEVNGKEFKIKVYGPYTFGIGDTTNFGKYIRGGYVNQVKKPKILEFKPIDGASKEPVSVISDFCKMEESNTIHLAFHATSLYQIKHKSLPRPWHPEDANEFVNIAKEYVDEEKFFPLSKILN